MTYGKWFWIGLLLVAGRAGAKVSKVVVFPDRAQVTRTETVACGARALVAFASIPPSADPATFRAHASVGTVEGMRAEERTRKESFSAVVKDLDIKLRKLTLERKALADQQLRSDGAATLAGRLTDVAVTQVGRELAEALPGTKAWTAAFEAALAARLRSSAVTSTLAEKLRDLDDRLDEARRRRRRLEQSAARTEFLAEVLVSCPTGRSATVELTYIVGGASWQPAYEARAEGLKPGVELSTFATVRQATGEDWSQAELILSTAIPRENATPPEIAKLKVWAEKREPPKKVLVSREAYTKHAETPGGNGDDDKAGDTRGRPLRAAEQGLSVQLVVPEPADVAGDGTPARLFVARTLLKGAIAYRTVPKLLPYVFRVADLTNGAPFPLLPGPVDAFRRNQFMARYAIERVAVGERFHLTFGIEESFKVKRITVEELERDKGVFGLTRRRRFSYRLEVQNFLGRPEELQVSEHIPVSELDDVKVTLNVKSTTAGHDLNAPDGIVLWKLRLGSGEKRTLELVYHVDVPASYESSGT